MAENITPAQVPVVGELEHLLGFDAANKWGKIKGEKIAQASQAYEKAQAAEEASAEALQTANQAKATAEGIDGKATAADNKATAAKTAADNAVTAASSATQTANQAKATADGIDQKASTALSQSTSAVSTAGEAKTAATKNDALLMGSLSVGGSTVTVYAGNFINGTLDPKAAAGQPNGKFRCLGLGYKTETHTLNIKGLDNFIAANLRGDLLVLVEGSLSVTLQVGGETQGVVKVGPSFYPTGLGGAIFRITFANIYGAVECLANCTFEIAEGARYFFHPVDQGADITVDAALSATSENPVQNKAVTAALNAKAPLASPNFSGSPTAPTPLASSNNTRIATTAYVKSLLSNYVPDTDGRLTDSRTPTGDAGGDLSGTYPNPTIKESVGLTGTPTAPTSAYTLDSTTKIATTEFVKKSMVAGKYTVSNVDPAFALMANHTPIYIINQITTLTVTSSDLPIVIDGATFEFDVYILTGQVGLRIRCLSKTLTLAGLSSSKNYVVHLAVTRLSNVPYILYSLEEMDVI